MQQHSQLPPLRLPEILKGQLENKVGVVTGASRGIGAAAAITLAKAGAKVALAARSTSLLEATAHAIDPSGTNVLVSSTDVADATSVEHLVQSTMEKFGRLDFAFNNAGDGHMPLPLADVGIEDFDRAIRTNVRGAFLCMKYEIPAMLRGGGGAIVNMSSTAGLQGVKGIGGYVAGKHAIIGMSQTAALDYARQNIRVNVVAPGPILTERLANIPNRDPIAAAVPMGRIGNREEVAQVVAWLCSDLSSFVTGVTIPVDGGRMAGVWF